MKTQLSGCMAPLVIAVLLIAAALVLYRPVEAQGSVIPVVSTDPSELPAGTKLADVAISARVFQVSSGSHEVLLRMTLTEPQIGLLDIAFSDFDGASISCGPNITDPCFVDAVVELQQGEDARLRIDYSVVDILPGRQTLGSYSLFVDGYPVVTSASIVVYGRHVTFIPTLQR